MEIQEKEVAKYMEQKQIWHNFRIAKQEKEKEFISWKKMAQVFKLTLEINSIKLLWIYQQKLLYTQLIKLINNFLKLSNMQPNYFIG